MLHKKGKYYYRNIKCKIYPKIGPNQGLPSGSFR